MRADQATSEEILRAIDWAAGAFRERDIESFLKAFAPDPDVVMIGTGKDEKCMGRDEIRKTIERAWSQSESASFKIGWSSISKAGNVAWVTSDARVRARIDGEDFQEEVRFTFVFEKREGRWLIVQSHDSLPAAVQDEGRSWATPDHER